MALLAGGISKIATTGAYYFFMIRIGKKIQFLGYVVGNEIRIGGRSLDYSQSGRHMGCKETRVD